MLTSRDELLLLGGVVVSPSRSSLELPRPGGGSSCGGCAPPLIFLLLLGISSGSCAAVHWAIARYFRRGVTVDTAAGLFALGDRAMRCSRRGVTLTRPQASGYTVSRSFVQLQGLGFVEPGESDSEVRVWDGRGSCATVRGTIVQYSPRRTRSDDRNVCLLGWRRMCEKGQWQ